MPEEQCPAYVLPAVTWPQAIVICVLSVVALVFVVWLARWISSW